MFLLLNSFVEIPRSIVSLLHLGHLVFIKPNQEYITVRGYLYFFINCWERWIVRFIFWIRERIVGLIFLEVQIEELLTSMAKVHTKEMMVLKSWTGSNAIRLDVRVERIDCHALSANVLLLGNTLPSLFLIELSHPFGWALFSVAGNFIFEQWRFFHFCSSVRNDLQRTE